MNRRVAFLALLSTFLALPAAADVCPECPMPKPPTCAERIERARAHNCIVQPEPQIVTVTKEVPVAGPERIVTKEVQVPGPERIVTKTVEVDVPIPPKGHALFGAGPMYEHGWGATVVVCYQFKSGWQFIAGPTWNQHRDTNGTVLGCRSGEPNAAML